VLVALAQIIIRPHFVLSGLASQTFSSIPLIWLNSHPESMVLRELFLAQIGWFSQFVIFAVVEIIDMSGHEFSLREVVILSFRLKNLLDFIVNNIFLNLAKPKISRINIPVVLPFLLFSSLKISMGLEVHKPDIFRLKHVNS
jgi:hypothetical protein